MKDCTCALKRKVLEEVKNVDGVVEAHLVNGVYDIIVVLEAEGLNRIRKNCFED